MRVPRVRGSGLKSNGPFWAHYVRDLVLEEIAVLRETVIDRALPSFAETCFGGHPYTTRRAVNAWIREGLVKETRATGPKGNPFKVLTLRRSGVATVRKLAIEQGLDSAQYIRSGARLQQTQLSHDTAIYRACGVERRRLLKRGAAIRRVRLDGELKSAVARRSESARVRDGRRAADAERHRAAGELGLPIDAQGRALYPDAQIEYTEGPLHPSQGRRRVPDARERSRRGACASGARLQRGARLDTRSGRAGSGRARALAHRQCNPGRSAPA